MAQMLNRSTLIMVT